MMDACKKKKEALMGYRALPLLLLSLFLFTDAFAEQKIYQNGSFRVRQTGETCKLEVFLESKNLKRSQSKFWRHGFSNETIGFFSVFKTDDYFGELITEKARVGLAKAEFSVKFDGRADRNIMTSDSTGSDNLWQWRHFSYQQGILDKIKRGNKMEVLFSNGEHLFHFEISLKGSSKAVRFLEKCRGR